MQPDPFRKTIGTEHLQFRGGIDLLRGAAQRPGLQPVNLSGYPIRCAVQSDTILVSRKLFADPTQICRFCHTLRIAIYRIPVATAPTRREQNSLSRLKNFRVECGKTPSRSVLRPLPMGRRGGWHPTENTFRGICSPSLQ